MASDVVEEVAVVGPEPLLPQRASSPSEESPRPLRRLLLCFGLLAALCVLLGGLAIWLTRPAARPPALRGPGAPGDPNLQRGEGGFVHHWGGAVFDLPRGGYFALQEGEPTADGVWRFSTAQIRDFARPCDGRGTLVPMRVSFLALCPELGPTPPLQLRSALGAPLKVGWADCACVRNGSACLGDAAFAGTGAHWALPDYESFELRLESKGMPDYLRLIANISFQSDECRLDCRSPGGDLVQLHRLSHFCYNNESGCGFETPCDWAFEPPKGQEAFTVVAGREGNGKSVIQECRDHTCDNPSHYAYVSASGGVGVEAMVVSPFYQYTSRKCHLSFRYRLFGMPGTSIIVTAQMLEGEDGRLVAGNPMIIHKIYSQTAYAGKWTTESVEVGQGAERVPMRLRLEAHLNTGADFPVRTQTSLNHSADAMLDDIRLVDCNEELYHPDPCKGGGELYMCPGSKKCVNVATICDMTRDCPGGEDEDDLIHGCSEVPAGARCNFEGPKDCPGWVSLPTPKKKSWKRLNAATLRAAARSPADLLLVTDHTYVNDSGNFMHVSVGDYTSSASFTPDDMILLRSQRFPAHSPSIHDPESPLFGRCRVSFYICQHHRALSTAASLHVYPVAGRPTNIWSPKSVQRSKASSHHCVWERVSLRLPRMHTEFFFVFQALPLFRIELGLDDFSLHPACFQGNRSGLGVLPSAYELGTCGRGGRTGPRQANCDAAYNATPVHVQLAQSRLDQQRSEDDAAPGDRHSNFPGYQRWLTPRKGEYKLLAKGASGGAYPGGESKNFGGSVESKILLLEDEQLDIVIGQRGLGPCDDWHDHSLKRRDSPAYVQLLAALCGGETRPAELLRLPGGGGGGATWVSRVEYGADKRARRRLLIVAGGGGGGFALSNPDASGGRRAGRRAQTGTGADVAFSDSLLTSGGGGGWDCGSSECEVSVASGGAGRSGSLGGHCRSSDLWHFPGGFGGGGASCGPGGGGGGGFVGGGGGNGTSGGGGLSWVLGGPDEGRVRSGVNEEGDGSLVITPCGLPCPDDATCIWNTHDQQVCRCDIGGNFLVDLSLDKCAEAEAEVGGEAVVDPDVLLVFAVTVGLLLAIVCGAVACIFYYYKCGRGAAASKTPKYSQAFMEQQGFPLHVFQQTSVPNYVYGLSMSGANFVDLPNLNRNFISLIKPLGQGAFGEVYEGIFADCRESGGQAGLRIAVKTLPELATEQSQVDFRMEALIMSKFNHRNIVRFIGVCFEKMPRFLVLELLGGGDLKTFLRDNRPSPRKPASDLAMRDLVEMSLDVARGCEYLEENHFIHRDIAARNCLLTARESGRVVKIADFGMARDIYRNDYYKKGGKAMLPVRWMPPEAFLEGIFTSKTDVWSFGILLWEMFSMGYMPYPGRHNEEVMTLITAGGRLSIPNGCPPQIYAVMRECWATLAEERAKFSIMIERLGACLADEELTTLPLPPVASRRSIPGGSESEAGTSAPDTLTDSSCLPEPMPTKGTGITASACAPYTPKASDAYFPLPSPRASQASSVSDAGALDSLLGSSTRGSQPPILEDEVFAAPPRSSATQMQQSQLL